MKILLSGIWPRVTLVVASLLLFLASVKNHGRLVRLKRQLAGHWQVSLACDNHPWVEALWQRDRMSYWSIALGLAALGLVYTVLARRAPPPGSTDSRAQCRVAVARVSRRRETCGRPRAWARTARRAGRTPCASRARSPAPLLAVLSGNSISRNLEQLPKFVSHDRVRARNQFGKHPGPGRAGHEAPEREAAQTRAHGPSGDRFREPPPMAAMKWPHVAPCINPAPGCGDPGMDGYGRSSGDADPKAHGRATAPGRCPLHHATATAAASRSRRPCSDCSTWIVLETYSAAVAPARCITPRHVPDHWALQVGASKSPSTNRDSRQMSVSNYLCA